MPSDHEAFFEIEGETARRAIAPETGTETEDRSESRPCDREEGKGVLVRSSDLRSLRAAINGWRRLISVAKETERLRR